VHEKRCENTGINYNQKMKDIEMRVLIRYQLAKKFGLNIRIADELKIGKGFAIADMVAFSPRLHCYEIKSNHDSLRRLHTQIEYYAEYFERTTIVCGTSFAEKVLSSTESWVGVWLIEDDQSIKHLRPAKKSPYFNRLKILECLWKDELVKLVNIHVISVKKPLRYATKTKLIEELSKVRGTIALHKDAVELIESRKC
jgi:hypothetical protein